MYNDSNMVSDERTCCCEPAPIEPLASVMNSITVKTEDAIYKMAAIHKFLFGAEVRPEDTPNPQNYRDELCIHEDKISMLLSQIEALMKMLGV